jgi:hypothetical protein
MQLRQFTHDGEADATALVCRTLFSTEPHVGTPNPLSVSGRNTRALILDRDARTIVDLFHR